MINKKVYFDKDRESVYLETYAFKCTDVGPRDAVLVIPGGGYSAVCKDREGESIALAYAGKGVCAFVLNYTVPPKAPTEPLIEAAGAFAYVKKHAKELGINPDRIFVIGFSAGGHLAGLLSTKFRKAEKILNLPECFLRPAGTLYCYPVITAMCETHIGSYEKLLRKSFAEISEDEKKEYSHELNVSGETPPAFIWHTASDDFVPPYGSIRLAESYVRAGVEVEFHLYPKGNHGLALAVEHTSLGRECWVDPKVEGWFDLSFQWIKSIS